MMRPALKCVVFATLLCVIVSSVHAGDQPENKESPKPGDRLAWWRDAKFGMFIHWGPYSRISVDVPGSGNGEVVAWPIMQPDLPGLAKISEADYRALPQRFNPVSYDPKAWVRLAKAAGQRYIVITTKHHDGFSMFDSMYSSYKITNTPYRKDIIAELAAASKEEGMPLGFYYSPPDMTHPGFRDTSKLTKFNWQGEPMRAEWVTYLDYMELQLTELLTRYGKVAVMWFDGLENQQKYNGPRFHKLIHELQPDTLINNRIGLRGDFDTPEMIIPDRIPTISGGVEWISPVPPSKISGPITIPKPEDFRPWETCMAITNNSWGYNKNDRSFKSSQELIRMLVEVASKGGNFLLNVGPTPEGTIQPEFQERLLAMGQWLKVNGEAIYGTIYGPWQNLQFGKTTAKGKTVYLHVFDWPRGKLEFDGPDIQLKQVTVLASGKPLQFTQIGSRISIAIPPEPPDRDVSVLALTVE